MNHRLWVFGAFLFGVMGCAHTSTPRLQAEDETDKDKPVEVKTLGDLISFSNTEPIPVSGVGLVVGLDGTGGGAPSGPYRTMLEGELQKQRVTNIKEVLASHNTSLVLVSAQIPAGAHKGDLLDVAVSVPRESKTTSLRGGKLLACTLFNYGNRKSLDPNFKGPDGTMLGHAYAQAEGQLVVGFGDGDETARMREARIWSGAKNRLERPYYIVLNSDQQYARVAKVVADRVNETFQGGLRGPMTDLAVAETKTVVLLTVPAQYRLNQQRYLRVVRLIPMREKPADRIPYRRRLEEQLLDPAHTVTAALRLEALGQESLPTLKRGLASEHPLVRFSAAEALAYLGSPSCGEELARTVKDQPALRAFSLTALASLDEAVCHVELRKLLGSESPETLYGAFRALRALDERDEAIQGEMLNDSFWLHRVTQGSMPLAHISTTNRAEIVLFGEDLSLTPKFALLAGEFTLTAGEGDQRCTITRISNRRGVARRQCGLSLNEVLHTLAELGGSYGEAVELLRQADKCQSLNCRVAVDALPQATSVYDLAKTGAGDPELAKTHPEILEARADFGATPTLFETSTHHSRSARDNDDEPVVGETRSKPSTGSSPN